MTWGKMDDKFHRNRKVRELRRLKGGREALGDWAFWWSWCLDDAELTGVIPSFELDAAGLRSAKLLVQVGLWDEVEGGYAFHDFHEYNPTKAQREAKKTADRERVSAKRHGISDDVACDISASRDGLAGESQESRERVASTRDPVPSQPVPSERESARDGIETSKPLASDDPLQGPRWYLLNGFRKRWESARGLMWPGHQYQPDPTEPTRWLVDACQKHGVPFEAAADDILDRWFAEDWPRKQKFPWKTFCKQIPNYVPDIPQVAE